MAPDQAPRSAPAHPNRRGYQHVHRQAPPPAVRNVGGLRQAPQRPRTLKGAQVRGAQHGRRAGEQQGVSAAVRQAKRGRRGV